MGILRWTKALFANNTVEEAAVVLQEEVKQDTYYSNDDKTIWTASIHNFNGKNNLFHFSVIGYGKFAKNYARLTVKDGIPPTFLEVVSHLPTYDRHHPFFNTDRYIRHVEHYFSVEIPEVFGVNAMPITYYVEDYLDEVETYYAAKELRDEICRRIPNFLEWYKSIVPKLTPTIAKVRNTIDIVDDYYIVDEPDAVDISDVMIEKLAEIDNKKEVEVDISLDTATQKVNISDKADMFVLSNVAAQSNTSHTSIISDLKYGYVDTYEEYHRAHLSNGSFLSSNNFIDYSIEEYGDILALCLATATCELGYKIKFIKYEESATSVECIKECDVDTIPELSKVTELEEPKSLQPDKLSTYHKNLLDTAIAAASALAASDDANNVEMIDKVTTYIPNRMSIYDYHTSLSFSVAIGSHSMLRRYNYSLTKYGKLLAYRLALESLKRGYKITELELLFAYEGVKLYDKVIGVSKMQPNKSNTYSYSWRAYVSNNKSTASFPNLLYGSEDAYKLAVVSRYLDRAATIEELRDTYDDKFVHTDLSDNSFVERPGNVVLTKSKDVHMSLDVEDQHQDSSDTTNIDAVEMDISDKALKALTIGEINALKEKCKKEWQITLSAYLEEHFDGKDILAFIKTENLKYTGIAYIDILGIYVAYAQKEDEWYVFSKEKYKTYAELYARITNKWGCFPSLEDIATWSMCQYRFDHPILLTNYDIIRAEHHVILRLPDTMGLKKIEIFNISDYPSAPDAVIAVREYRNILYSHMPDFTLWLKSQDLQPLEPKEATAVGVYKQGNEYIVDFSHISELYKCKWFRIWRNNKASALERATFYKDNILLHMLGEDIDLNETLADFLHSSKSRPSDTDTVKYITSTRSWKGRIEKGSQQRYDKWTTFRLVAHGADTAYKLAVASAEAGKRIETLPEENLDAIIYLRRT